MADTIATEELKPLEIGTVFSSAFSLMGSHPLTAFGISFILGALPTRLLAYATSVSATQTPTAVAANLFHWLGSMVVQVIVGGMLTGTALIVAHGDKAESTAGLRRGLQRMAALISVGLLYALGCLIGISALVIPFFFLWIRWSVVGQVVVAEDIGISAAFGRSSELTKGCRLGILGLLLLAGLIQSLFGMLITLLIMPLAGLSHDAVNLATDPGAVAGQAAMETLAYGFAAAIQCALYVELKQRHAGPIADRLSTIFA
jgi:hypothetical protein